MEELAINPLNISSLLVALELDTPDEGILRFAKTLSDAIHPETLHLLHVIPDLRPAPPLTGVQTDSDWTADFELRHDLSSHLHALAKRWFGDSGQHVWQASVEEGNPLEVVVQATEHTKAQTVIIGKNTDRSHHSISPARLLRRIPVDTFVVPDKATGRIERILVPIDFSGHSIRALHKAIALSESMPTPAQITAIHVYELPNFSLYRTSRTPAQWEAMVADSKREALDLFISSHAGPYLDSIERAVVKKDLPGLPQYILKQSEVRGCDLIVMGAKGHSAVELVLMGSVTEHIVNSATTTPVWVVR